ncbi:MAG: hypothetical protein AUK48_01540 [Oscillatoriales cyanobacterium CG2_30_44_21]|nr:MAG: hypothetical protein AUK48_01540 [Oscillatoriales cyanobacterium CG2_30_44_21]
MQKLILGCLVSIAAIAIPAAAINAQNVSEYLDNRTPQVIEKISGNIVTFKNATGESNNYYVPNWMLDKYALRIGTSANLYNRNITQGIYRDEYIDVSSQSLMGSTSSFALHDTRSGCVISERLATEGLASGKRVWFKTEGCPSTIPIVGAMSFYEAQSFVSAQQRDLNSMSPSETLKTVQPETVNKQSPDPTFTRNR